MSLESDIYDALESLVDGRVFPDYAPHDTQFPFITYQQVGGDAENFLESAVVGKRNARIQVNCVATTRLTANELARAAEDAMITSGMKAYVLSAFMAFDESATAEHTYATHQDFSVWY